MTYSPKRPGAGGGLRASPLTIALVIAVSLVIIIIVISASLSNDIAKSANDNANYYLRQVKDYVLLSNKHADHHAAHPTVATRAAAEQKGGNDQHPGDRHRDDKAKQMSDDHAGRALGKVLDSAHQAIKNLQPLIEKQLRQDAENVAQGRAALECPPYDAEALDKLQIPLKHLPRKKKTSVGQKYDRRAHNCASHGIWNRVRIKDHHDILHTIVKLGHIQRGAFIFDWGSGCGHSMQWLHDEYNVTGLGVDVSKLTIEYARENTTKKNTYCVADGTKLDWIPSNIFDHAISFGSIYHVYNRTLFCHVLRQLVRIVRPVTGTVYNGWTENAEYKRNHIGLCLDDLPVHFDVLEEKAAFKHVEIFPLKAQQQEPNTYSLVIEKRGVVPADEEKAKFSLDGVPIACDEHVCVKKKDEKGMAMLAKRAEADAAKKKSKKGGRKSSSGTKKAAAAATAAEDEGSAQGGDGSSATTKTTSAVEKDE